MATLFEVNNQSEKGGGAYPSKKIFVSITMTKETYECTVFTAQFTNSAFFSYAKPHSLANVASNLNSLGKQGVWIASELHTHGV